MNKISGIRQILFASAAGILISFNTFGQQKKWTLDECIQYARENNISVKMQKFNLDISGVNLKQSWGMMLPSVSGYVSQSYNYGQTVDRFTNQFASEVVRSNNFYVSANMTLFNGFQLLNSVQKSHFDLLASKCDQEVVENEISLTVATAYLQILYSKEMVDIAQRQYEMTMLQVDRMAKMVQAGAESKTTLLGLQAQAAAEEYQLTTMQTQYEMAKLTLMQLLDLPYSSDFAVYEPEIDISGITLPYTSDYIFQYAVEHLPEIKGAEYRVESANRSYKIAKGSYSPNLSFGVSVGTGYSGARQNISDVNFAGVDTIGITTGTPAEYVLAPLFEYLYEPVSFKDQIDQNFNRTVGFNLSIPIFSSLQTISNVQRSKISLGISELNLQQSKLNLQKTISQAQLDAVSALKKYQSALKQVESAEAVYKLSKERFELDDMSIFEYKDAKTKMVLAESELLQAKFELIFKMKILDFYMGKEIKL